MKRTIWNTLQNKFSECPWKWGTLAVLLVGLLALIVVGFPLALAINIHVHLGYYCCLFLFLSLIFSGWRMIRSESVLQWGEERWKGLLLVLFLSVFVHFFQPHIMRVFNDEPAHQMTAKIFHEERENSVPEVGYYLKGDVEYGERSLNYRMYFYPFLVSVLHDLTGFRPSNGLIVNGFLGLLLFLSVYLGGNRIYSKGGGVLAVLLLAGLPLLDTSVTGYGYDVANLLFLSLLFLALSLYSERRSEDCLNWLLLLALTLAYSRNESVLYLIPVGVLFIVIFLCDPRANITRFACLSPLFLLPVFAARRIFQAVMVDLQEVFPHLNSGTFFSLDFIPANFSRVGVWLLDFSTATLSSPLLTLLGVFGSVALVSGIVGKVFGRKSVGRIDAVLLLFITSVFGAFVFVTLALFWNPTAGEAVRFLLPLHLAFVYVGVWAISQTKKPEYIMPRCIAVVCVAIFFSAIPTKMRTVGAENTVFANYAQWALDWLEENDNDNTLYLSQLHTLFLLHDYPSMDLTRASNHTRAVIQLEVEHYYSRILVFVVERHDPESGTWAPSRPALPLSDSYVTEVIAEVRWSYNQRARFLEVKGFRGEDGSIVATEDIEILKYDFENFEDYWLNMRTLHPGLR